MANSKVIRLQKIVHGGATKDTYECTGTENTPRVKVGEVITEDVVMDLINSTGCYRVIITPAKT